MILSDYEYQTPAQGTKLPAGSTTDRCAKSVLPYILVNSISTYYFDTALHNPPELRPPNLSNGGPSSSLRRCRLRCSSCMRRYIYFRYALYLTSGSSTVGATRSRRRVGRCRGTTLRSLSHDRYARCVVREKGKCMALRTGRERVEFRRLARELGVCEGCKRVVDGHGADGGLRGCGYECRDCWMHPPWVWW